MPTTPRQALATVVLAAFLAVAAQVAPCRAQQDDADIRPGRLELLVIGLPMSPLHGIVSIGQELCLRGHNVTVVSVGEDGLKKTRKYSPKCAVNYVSLGPSPLTKEEIGQAVLHSLGSTNNTLMQMHKAATTVFQKFWGIMDEPLDKLLAGGVLKPDYALVSLPVGSMKRVLDHHAIDYAINIPTSLLPPLIDHVARWVPPMFMYKGVEDLSFLDRLLVIGFNSVVHVAKHAASALGVLPASLGDLDPSSTRGKLVLVNSIPGLDYPQPLPPLVQYTGPVIDLDMMEAFPLEVEEWMSAVPEGRPVVYISYGTVVFLEADQVQHIVRTLSDGDVWVLWALPKDQQAGLPADLPPHMMVHHWIPTPRALGDPRVKAFVSHCGGNSVAESMAMGKPIVGYPQGGDQPGNCMRVADTGAGVACPKQSWLRKEDVMEVLGKAEYTDRAQALSRLFDSFGGVKKAADLIEVGARGDLALMVPPTDRSFRDWWLLGGYDLMIGGFVLSHLALYLGLRMVKAIARRVLSGGESSSAKSTKQE